MKQGHRLFDADGLPLCAAGFPMPRLSVFTNRTSLVQHQRGRYGCPLLYPAPTGEVCLIEHSQWPTSGCKLVMPTVPGARICYQLDRDDVAFKAIYRQRTAVERTFSQAVALGIERPKLRAVKVASSAKQESNEDASQSLVSPNRKEPYRPAANHPWRRNLWPSRDAWRWN